MITVRRVSTTGGMIQIAASEPPKEPGGPIGVAQTFYFFPAGSDEGPTSNVMPDWAVNAVMTDAGIAHHFECTPPWGPAVPGGDGGLDQ